MYCQSCWDRMQLIPQGGGMGMCGGGSRLRSLWHVGFVGMPGSGWGLVL